MLLPTENILKYDTTCIYICILIIGFIFKAKIGVYSCELQYTKSLTITGLKKYINIWHSHSSTDRFFKVREIRVSEKYTFYDPAGTSCEKYNSKASGWELNLRPWISRPTLYRLSYKSRCREQYIIWAISHIYIWNLTEDFHCKLLTLRILFHNC